jgi:pyruvate/2-oxoglutarate dehydrogenase complex dihydrolipoamide dehydrogenase (E3) component
MKYRYDFVSIGGGSAGFNAARVAAGLGKRVAVVDGARKLGGLCILRGCMPSKTLIYSAEVLHLAQRGVDFGLKVSPVSADMAAMHRRKNRIVGDFARYRAHQLQSGRFKFLRGTAHFVDPHTVELDDGRRITSKTFLLSTGSKVSVPPIPGLANVPYWTSDDVLDLDFTPRSVIVLGGGIVACELAQFLKRVGTRVCMIQRSPHILSGHSKESSGVIRKAFEDEGIEVLTDTRIVGVHSARGRFSVSFRRKGRTLLRKADHLFNALGREPATEGLSLKAAGVETAENGRVLINRWQQTSTPNIYAAGDCSGPHEIVHIAIQQAELAARHAAGTKGLRPVDDATLLSVVFTDPQLATIGWNERELKKKGIRYISASYPFDDHGKAILMGAKHGFIKVLADAKVGRILGAEIVGKDAGELIHCFSTPISMRATVQDMHGAPWYHPTLSEIVTYPIEELFHKTRNKRR